MRNPYDFKKYFLNFFIGLSILMLSAVAYSAANNTDQAVSDTTITAKIKAKYLQSSLLSVFNISVKTDHGKVMLSGQVDSDTQYERALVLAENTDGVKSVNSDNLQIKSSQQPLSDTLITAKVKGALLKNKLVSDETEANPWAIHVETKDGVVYLTGAVDNKEQKNRAIQSAKLVEGVKSVKADLNITK